MLPPVNPPRHLSEAISTKLGPCTSLHSRSVQARAMLTSTRQIPAAIADAHGTQSACDDRTVDAIPIPDPFGTGGAGASPTKGLQAAGKPRATGINDKLCPPKGKTGRPGLLSPAALCPVPLHF